MQRLGGFSRRALSALRLLPAGGVVGQLLQKVSSADYDASWVSTLLGGFITNSFNLGTITGSNQSITANYVNGQHQHCTLNGSSLTGTLTINPPAASTQVVLEVTNGGTGAVAATLAISATKTDGTWVNTNGSKFMFIFTRTQNYSHCQIVPLQ